MLKTNKISM